MSRMKEVLLDALERGEDPQEYLENYLNRVDKFATLEDCNDSYSIKKPSKKEDRMYEPIRTARPRTLSEV